MTKRATVHFDESLHKALRIKAAGTDQSISDLVNVAVRDVLLEDSDDLEAFRERAGEPALAFEELVRDLKRRGKLKGVEPDKVNRRPGWWSTEFKA